MTAPPPRIFGILAREAPVVALFRRGPSRRALLLSWDLRDDRITPGQWLAGRIYERRADLSPDGRHLIYFAMDGRWQGPLGGSWTAVSRLPWLTALHLYGWGHCWNGGGLFLDNHRYWLNGGRAGGLGAEVRVDCGLRPVDVAPEGVVPAMGEDPVTYHPRLLRDGWRFAGPVRDGLGNLAHAYDRSPRPGWTLHKTFHLGRPDGRTGPVYSESHLLTGPDGPVPFAAEWAEARGSELLFARDGAIWRQNLHRDAAAPARRIADLSAIGFAATDAPCAGVVLRSGASA